MIRQSSRHFIHYSDSTVRHTTSDYLLLHSLCLSSKNGVTYTHRKAVLMVQLRASLLHEHTAAIIAAAQKSQQDNALLNRRKNNYIPAKHTAKCWGIKYYTECSL